MIVAVVAIANNDNMCVSVWNSAYPHPPKSSGG